MENQLTNKAWITNPKIQSRYFQFTHSYLDIFKKSVPKGEQFFSMCGNMANGNKLNPRCEALQVTESNLGIKPNQYYGVDTDRKIIERNQQLLPNYNWYCDSLGAIIYKKYREKTLNPAIINIDHHLMIKNSSYLFFNILNVINCLDKRNILVVLNFMLQNPYSGKEDSLDSICTHLVSNHNYRKFRQSFKEYELGRYEYEGTGQGKKKFLGLIFYKK